MKSPVPPSWTRSLKISPVTWFVRIGGALMGRGVKLAISVPEPSLFVVPNSIMKFEFMFCDAGEGL
jgi:hypothetical protein